MGGWNRSRHARGHRDRRPSRPPLPPPDYGHDKCPVPLWEREFCCYVGNMSWQRFCQNKQYVGPFNDLGHWDDSGALENFQNAKARFWAYYHGQPSDIPLPDPDLYIDRVDHHCKVDTELVADLDKLGLPFDSDNNSAAATEADKAAANNQSGNWDMYLEKQAEINNWGSEQTPRPDATWGVKHEPFDNWGNNNSGWGDAAVNPSWHASSNNHYSSNWGNSNSGWDDAAVHPSWHASSNNCYSSNWGNSNSGWDDAVVNPSLHASNNNHYSSKWGNSNSGWDDAVVNPSWHASSSNHYSSNNRDDIHGGGSNNRYQDLSNMSGRKRSSGAHFQHSNSRQRNQTEGYPRSGWQDRRGRNHEWRPVHNRDRQNAQRLDGGA